MFKAVSSILAFFIASLILPVATIHAQNVQDFYFDSFKADYYISREADGSSHMQVVETLNAVFPNYPQNHGILRALPSKYKDHKLGLIVKSVTNAQGEAYKYTSSIQNDNKVLKIGDPATYAEGPTTYVISYQYRDVMSFYADHDELYWDINGDQWDQTFKSVQATFHIPADIAKNINKPSICYAGGYGSLNQSCTVTTTATPTETLINAKAEQITPSQTLSVVSSFNPSTFKLSSNAKHEIWLKKADRYTGIMIVVAAPIIAFTYLFKRWRRYGNDPKGRGVIVPQYEPPKGLSIIQNSFIETEKLGPTAITATIINMAIKGVLVIYEVPKKGLFGHKDYEVEIKSLPDSLSADEKWVLNLVFSDLKIGSRQSMNDFKNKAIITTSEISKYQKSLSSNMAVLGYFQRDPSKISSKYILTGFLLLGGGFALIYLNGFSNLFLWSAYGLAAGLILASIITFIFSAIISAKTETGVEVRDWMKGLKDYIKMAEADRLRYLQSPEGANKISNPSSFNPDSSAEKVKLFERLLPYAILFGLEKDWAKQFDSVYSVQPVWYYGAWGAFSANDFGNSLNSFGSSFAQSSGASSSGFGGGGAGGGGGGGGGGGW